MRLRSVELELPRRDAAVEFLWDTWGLIDAGRRGSTAFLRGTGDHPYLVALTEAAAPRAIAITFAGTEVELGAIRNRFAAAGQSAPEIVAAFDEPGSPGGFFVSGAEGQRFRFVTDREPAAPIPDGDRPVQLTHVVLNARDREACARFTTDALGFSVSDRTRMMTFVRCNRKHHALAFAEAEIGSLHHIAFEMTSLDAVMRGVGRLRDLGLAPAWGPGRHGPGNNVFAYFITPFSAVVEYTAEVQEVDGSYRVGGPDDWKWPPNRIDHWGLSTRDTERLSPAERTFRFRGEAA
ncbi:MAG TPA: VOC family protein [Burkholderiales bacterium]|nr:VOC family protein [Burkholderiales bacterium]